MRAWIRAIQDAVASLGLPCELGFETVRRGGFRATYAKVVTPHEHAHRHWHHIEAIIDKGKLTDRQKDLAKRVFLKLGEAEARVHGVDLSKIHFHEVGAVDSIVDIVGSAWGSTCWASIGSRPAPCPRGAGGSRPRTDGCPCRHPPPPSCSAASRWPSRWSMRADHARPAPPSSPPSSSGSPRSPPMTIESIGLGAGTRELHEQANIVRLFVGTVDLPPSAIASGCSRPTSTTCPARSSATP